MMLFLTEPEPSIPPKRCPVTLPTTVLEIMVPILPMPPVDQYPSLLAMVLFRTIPAPFMPPAYSPRLDATVESSSMETLAEIPPQSEPTPPQFPEMREFLIRVTPPEIPPPRQPPLPPMTLSVMV